LNINHPKMLSSAAPIDNQPRRQSIVAPKSILPDDFRSVMEAAILPLLEESSPTDDSDQRLYGVIYHATCIWLVQKGVRHPLRSICGEQPFLLVTKHVGQGQGETELESHEGVERVSCEFPPERNVIYFWETSTS
jgi:hypothetical protein